jgi:Tubulin like
MDLNIEGRLKKRKLDALRRGVHRVGAEAALPFNVHLVGIGKAGATVVAEVLNALQPSDRVMSALVIDVGDDDLKDVRKAAAALPPGRAIVDVIALAPVDSAALSSTFHDYEQHLKLEYPLFPWKLDGRGWLPSSGARLTAGGGVRRSYAKALYGRAYYDGDRSIAKALRRFGERVERERAQSIVCVAFGMGGGTGSGIVVDLARHLTNVVLGRQALVVGLGILPCDGDRPEHRGGGLFATLNELDCLGDEVKNNGLVASCGELFRNPFTAGLLLVPQQHVWSATGNLAQTHERVNAEVTSLLTERDGANLMETLRMLNWVAAPSTQHSAARTPWGAKWIHMFGFSDLDDERSSSNGGFRVSLGIDETYKPEFIEVRVPAVDQNSATAAAARLEAAFSPDVPPQITGHGRKASAQFVLPSIRKTEISWFRSSLDIYRREDQEEKLLDHSLLLDQGILLSEPSDRILGMAGASICGAASWVAIPMNTLLDE